MTTDNGMDPNEPLHYRKPKIRNRSVICKALGAKASTCDTEANYVCYVRILLVSLAILTNAVIIYGVVTR